MNEILKPNQLNRAANIAIAHGVFVDGIYRDHGTARIPKKERNCKGCPLKEKRELYHRAAVNRVLAIDLAKMQKIGEDDLVAHFGKTAAQLDIICKSQVLCGRYGR